MSDAHHSFVAVVDVHANSHANGRPFFLEQENKRAADMHNLIHLTQL
jgi:hypothetical protein